MMTNLSPFKWKYEKLVDREIDEYRNLLSGHDDEETATGYDIDVVRGRQLLQDQTSLNIGQETIIPDLEYSKDYYKLKKRSQNEKELDKKPDRNHYIFHRIEKGDTLQGIALKWHCPLHELKRVNNLVSDRDFYGLNIIKIPVKKYGILSEVMVHQVNSSLTLLDETPHETTNKPLIINVGLRQTFLNDDNAQDMKKFLSNLDADLAEMRKVVDSYSQGGQSASSIAQEIDPSSNFNNHNLTSSSLFDNKSSNYQCDGADCGFSWYSLMFVALFILILVPVIYAFVFDKSHPFRFSM